MAEVLVRGSGDAPNVGPDVISNLSVPIAIYRPQAEYFGGRSDGKFGVRLEEISYFQVPIRAGDY
jgi:hypothetical protein